MSEQKRYNYHILPELNLIIDSFSGTFTYDEIITCKINQAKDSLWRSDYNVLADIRNLKITYTEDIIRSYAKPKGRVTEIISKRKSAALTLTPDQVVFEFILQSNTSLDLGIEINFFSTLNAALSWLGIDVKHLSKLNRIIDSLNDRMIDGK